MSRDAKLEFADNIKYLGKILNKYYFHLFILYCLYIMQVIYQQPNPGIKYQYQLPMTRSESVVYPPKSDAVIAPPLMRHSPGNRTQLIVKNLYSHRKSTRELVVKLYLIFK